MADSAREFFEDLRAHPDAARTAGMRNTYLFDIEGAGRWLVTVDDGTVSVEEGGGEADVTITTTEEHFLGIARRELNPATAYMTGKVRLSGDIGAALKLQKLF